MADAQPELWIFAYGSLMWRPDFVYAERQRGTLAGYHRSLCILSHVYRGTPENPGLVFGLDTGGACVGVAFRIAIDASIATLAAVRRREMILGVYREMVIPVLLDDGRSIAAFAYVADPAHPAYAGGLSHAAMLEIVRERVGASGSNADYVRNTQAHLLDLGVHDPVLEALCAELGADGDAAVESHDHAASRSSKR